MHGCLRFYLSWKKKGVGEKQPEMSAFRTRFYGRVSEIIFNVWLDYQIQSGQISQKDVKELPFIYMEKINWFRKGISFLKARYFIRNMIVVLDIKIG